MNIQKPSIFKNKKVLAAIAVSLIALIVAGGIAYALFWPKTTNESSDSTPRKTNDVNYQPPTDEQKEAGDAIKKDSVDSSGEDNTPTTNPSETPSTASPKSKVGVTITSPDTASGDVLNVRAFVNVVATTGTCRLELSKSGSQAVTQTAGIQASASTSVCKGFDVPMSGLSKGTWTATVKYENDTQVGSATKTITIQ